MSWLQNVWVSKCLDLYAVAQCLGGTMCGWQNVLLSKRLGVKMFGVKGVQRSCAQMFENPLKAVTP